MWTSASATIGCVTLPATVFTPSARTGVDRGRVGDSANGEFQHVRKRSVGEPVRRGEWHRAGHVVAGVSASGRAPRWLVASLYVAIGWTALAFVPVLWHQLGAFTFSLVVCGGVVYSVGAGVYAALADK